MRKTAKLVYISLLVAQALVLHIFESMIPMPLPTPGAKLGLANLISVIGLYTLDKKRDVLIIILLRLTLATMFGGNLSSFMYSFAGAILSYVMMIVVKGIGKDKVSIIGVSCSGGVFHNLGQLLIASMIVRNIGVMLYLPVLSLVGIGTGVFIGITANYAIKHMSKLPYFNKIS
ncbi:Gx transporter family protein [Clostridium sp. 'White wine YQ']|uniref:Gx transporter family protein n=1 Tax=Clostridium sp. 'White wine YQ' TaxID=3027474 RepID=UPI0023660553|nr:Gx transporter family protein [Clostridium sp. 'White wine YQ']MDD7792658.1 Gx transporter family protein [Clostridium sp. 'White wine YQ']